MPLTLNGDMINVLTDAEAFQRYVAHYRTLQRAKKNYYETHKEEILAKKRAKYAAAKAPKKDDLAPGV